MAKRNLDKFRRVLNNNDENSDLGNGKVEEDVIKNQEDVSEIIYLDFTDIIFNPNNTKGISMDVEDLIATIPTIGLVNPITVRNADEPGKYMVLSGERRVRAFIKLFNETLEHKYREIPCIVKDMSKIDLPLNDELKEKFVISTPNTNTRTYSITENMEMIEGLEVIYDELKKVNYDLSKYKDRRHYVAINMQKAETEIARIKKLSKSLIPEFIESVNHEELGKMTALEISKLEVTEQQQLYDTIINEKYDLKEMKDVDVLRFKNTGSLSIDNLVKQNNKIKMTPSESMESHQEEEKTNAFIIDFEKMERVLNLIEYYRKVLMSNNVALKDVAKINKEIEKISKSLTNISKIKTIKK